VFIRRTIVLGCLLAVALGGPAPAWAVDLNEVTTMLEPKNPYDFRLRIGYEAEIKTSALNREYMGNGAQVDIVKDLLFQQITHRLNIRAEFAIYKDLGIYLAFPIILAQQATYSFAKGDRYVGYAGEDTCRTNEHSDQPWLCNPDGVNAKNSRFVQDGLASKLRPDSGGELFEYDFGADPTSPADDTVRVPSAYNVGAGEAGPRTLFKGPSRQGLDQMHLGIHGLILAQKRHASLPDWRFGVEFRIAVGKVMDFKRDAQGDPEGCLAPGDESDPLRWNSVPG
jgi:hypothetical protein